MTAAVEVRGLRKKYGDNVVLAGIDFTVEAGKVLGILGPNGAGKSTTVDILTTRMRPDGGTARIFGNDVVSDRNRVRRQIAVARQDASVDLFLTGRENLVICGRLLGLTKQRSMVRAEDLLEQFDLSAAADRPVSGYSGGMRRRLDLALCLLGSPSIVFLDEPTTGLDPTSRLELWRIISGLVLEGTTIVLTTQYLEEADALADRILFLADGAVAADGTPAELKRRIDTDDRLQVTVSSADQLETARRALADTCCSDIAVDVAQCRLIARTTDGLDTLLQSVEVLRAAQVQIVDVGLRRPSLDEVFAALTDPERERQQVGVR